jgi:hypothetical protein
MGSPLYRLNDLRGWPAALSLVVLAAFTELLPVLFGAGLHARWDWGYIYVTLHFVVLPVACIAHIVANGIDMVRMGGFCRQRLRRMSSTLLPAGYLIFLYYAQSIWVMGQ